MKPICANLPHCPTNNKKTPQSVMRRFLSPVRSKCIPKLLICMCIYKKPRGDFKKNKRREGDRKMDPNVKCECHNYLRRYIIQEKYRILLSIRYESRYDFPEILY